MIRMFSKNCLWIGVILWVFGIFLDRQLIYPYAYISIYGSVLFIVLGILLYSFFYFNKKKSLVVLEVKQDENSLRENKTQMQPSVIIT